MGDLPIVDLSKLGSVEDHPRPLEEGDNTNRNTKNHRQDSGTFSGTESRVAREEEWMRDSPKNQEGTGSRMSNRDSVRNPSRSLNLDKEGEFLQDEENNADSGSDCSESSSEEDDAEPEEEGGGISIEKNAFERLNFTLSDREWKRLSRPFKKSLIIKLLGKMVGFKFLLRKVNQLWGRTGEVELVDLGNEYFLAKFDTYKEKIQKIAAWVHLPDLPIELYDSKFLSTLGNYIGKVLKIDANTTHQLRGKFARQCVEIDLSKPLLPQYCVHGRARKIEYEGLHLICFECGVYRHDLEHCPIYKARKEKEKQEKEGQNKSRSEKIEDEGDEKYSPYGAWMNVQKPRRNRRPKPGGQNQSVSKMEEPRVQGSHFATLEDKAQEEPEPKLYIEKHAKEVPKEQQGKTWTKSKENPVFETLDEHNSDDVTGPPDLMELGTPVKERARQKEKRTVAKEPPHVDMDQNANQDDLHLPTGPITRGKAKRIKQAMQGLMKQVHGDEVDLEELGMEQKLKAVNILQVQLKPK
ncbi:zinc ion binding nucleic acid binding protein [Senna tora]|uniref:Zinc ion binding nucleic acid binding protein n=1 Tax=Senna tora TaxID=362788 RepID=A0A834X5A2_9FABA|nr:zinc ion binding nucleic acid binding protein [Senna tora]